MLKAYKHTGIRIKMYETTFLNCIPRRRITGEAKKRIRKTRIGIRNISFVPLYRFPPRLLRRLKGKSVGTMRPGNSHPPRIYMRKSKFNHKSYCNICEWHGSVVCDIVGEVARRSTHTILSENRLIYSEKSYYKIS